MLYLAVAGQEAFTLAAQHHYHVWLHLQDFAGKSSFVMTIKDCVDTATSLEEINPLACLNRVSPTSLDSRN